MSEKEIEELTARFDMAFPPGSYRDDDGDWHEFSLGLDRDSAIAFAIQEVARVRGEQSGKAT